ncbi:nucleotidyl transferase AbiEii/AbiGii toxin family protein [Candidatus Parvarchaeota archaeon]|nr:nucleotidyl transferase AbiEii/AbiGii toxin family protein [Candidatus Parvarchaeota archaeon]
MISGETLLKIAKMEGLKPYQEEKKYIQTLILRAISNSASLVFKGGTALFLLYGLNRFSEDLDFTATSNLDFTGLLKEVSDSLQLMNIRNETMEYDSIAGFSGRIKAYGPLNSNERDACFVKIDISTREKISLKADLKEIDSNFPDLLPFSLQVMNEAEILAEKTRAVITRNQARDVYDLYFLLKKGIKFDVSLSNKKLEYYKLKFSIELLEKSLEKKKDIWKQELNPILIGNLPDFNDVKSLIIEKVTSFH